MIVLLCRFLMMIVVISNCFCVVVLYSFVVFFVLGCVVFIWC